MLWPKPRKGSWRRNVDYPDHPRREGSQNPRWQVDWKLDPLVRRKAKEGGHFGGWQVELPALLSVTRSDRPGTWGQGLREVEWRRVEVKLCLLALRVEASFTWPQWLEDQTEYREDQALLEAQEEAINTFLRSEDCVKAAIHRVPFWQFKLNTPGEPRVIDVDGEPVVFTPRYGMECDVCPKATKQIGAGTWSMPRKHVIYDPELTAFLDQTTHRVRRRRAEDRAKEIAEVRASIQTAVQKEEPCPAARPATGSAIARLTARRTTG